MYARGAKTKRIEISGQRYIHICAEGEWTDGMKKPVFSPTNLTSDSILTKHFASECGYVAKIFGSIQDWCGLQLMNLSTIGKWSFCRQPGNDRREFYNYKSREGECVLVMIE